MKRGLPHLLAIPTSAVARGGHGHGGHGSHGHHHHGHHFHGHGGVVVLPPPFWFCDGPLYYYDPLAVYPPGAMIYDPQTDMVWVPVHSERVGDSMVWVLAHWDPLRPRSDTSSACNPLAALGLSGLKPRHVPHHTKEAAVPSTNPSR